MGGRYDIGIIGGIYDMGCENVVLRSPRRAIPNKQNMLGRVHTFFLYLGGGGQI